MLDEDDHRTAVSQVGQPGHLGGEQETSPPDELKV